MPDPTAPDDTPKRDRFSWFLGAASVLLAMLVIVLGIQNRRLKQQIAEMEQSQAPRIESGERLDPIELIDGEGQLVALDDVLGGRRGLVLMFTPTCPACRASIPVWTELAGSLEAGAPPIIGINLAPVGSLADEPLLEAELPFPVYRAERSASPGLTRITHVPATILFADGGAVERSWFGQVDEAWASEMRAALGS